ncbi:MAG: SGNH/GDSL hydrolase family protein [Vicinamibacteria bacterium]
MSARGRALAQGLALAAGTVVVFLLLLEGVFRLAGDRLRPELASRRIFDGRWTTLLDCYPSNPRGYFDIDLRRTENDARYRHLAPLRFDVIRRHHPWAVESRYNALRFRDAPLGPKPAGVRRVMVLGDSFTEGQGVKQDETAVAVLGKLAARRAPGRIEVRNCAHRGTDFPELFGIFEEILPYEPDLVVYALVLNDGVQSAEFRARQEYVDDWILDRENVPDASGPPPRPASLAFDFFRGRVAAWRLGRETTRWYLDMWSDANPGWKRTREYVLEMDRRLKQRHARLLVAQWPLLVGLEGRYPFEPAHENIRKFCLASGIPYLDLLDALRGRRSADLWVHPVDRHPNEVAQRLAAEAMAPEVWKLLGD